MYLRCWSSLFSADADVLILMLDVGPGLLASWVNRKPTTSGRGLLRGLPHIMIGLIDWLAIAAVLVKDITVGFGCLAWCLWAPLFGDVTGIDGCKWRPSSVAPSGPKDVPCYSQVFAVICQEQENKRGGQTASTTAFCCPSVKEKKKGSGFCEYRHPRNTLAIQSWRSQVPHWPPPDCIPLLHDHGWAV